MDTTVETFEHAGLTVRIDWEEYSEYANPRDMDNLGIMYCWHPNYTLGDEQFHRGDHESMEDVLRYVIEERKAVGTIYPLYLYDHSGITVSTGPAIRVIEDWLDKPQRPPFAFDAAGWDTTHIGFVFTDQQHLDVCGTPLDLIAQALQGEVEEYASYLRGEVYAYVVEDENGEVLASCAGYVGYEPYAEAREAAEVERQALDSRAASEAAESAWAASQGIPTEGAA